MKGVKSLLNLKNGIFVTESHYAVNILDEMQFDSIYHEHLRFYLLKPLISLLSKYGFKVIDASKIPNYAGSIRVTATLNKKIKPKKSVQQIINQEKNTESNLPAEKKMFFLIIIAAPEAQKHS